MIAADLEEEVQIPVFVLKSTVIIFALSNCAANNQKEIDITSSKTNKFSLVANGEDFIRQGFISKDGWQIKFNHAYVTLNQVIAYQTDPPFDPYNRAKLQARESVTLVDQATTIDLAQGGENTPPIKVTEVSAPIGNYNAIAWKIVNNSQDNASIVLNGIATKDQRAINFVLKFSLELSYLCGEFIGDERKGILAANQASELETTFHFDHLFGDAQTPTDDDLNLAAIGFQPLANLTQNTDLKADLSTLQQQLSPPEYD